MCREVVCHHVMGLAQALGRGGTLPPFAFGADVAAVEWATTEVSRNCAALAASYCCVRFDLQDKRQCTFMVDICEIPSEAMKTVEDCFQIGSSHSAKLGRTGSAVAWI